MSQLQVTGEAKIRDIQGPVVANSGVITALNGAANQYVRGDGTLASFPTSGGGGSSVSYYLNGSVNQGTFGGSTYYQMSKNAIVGSGTNFSTSANGLIAQFITDANDPDVVSIPSGNWNVEFFMSVSASSGSLASFYVEIYKYNGSTFTLLATNVATPEQLTNTTTVDAYFTSVAMPLSSMSVTDRLAIRVFANVASKTVTLYTEDNRLCQVVTTFSKGMLSMNNLTDQSQYLTTGTAGTDFNIVSSGDTHTFNLPSASATNRGLITTGSQTIAGSKTFSSTTLLNSVYIDGLSYLKHQASSGGGIAGYTVFNALANGVIEYIFPTLFKSVLDFNDGADYTYTFPAASGTIALTSNLSSYVPYTGATASLDLGSNSLLAQAVTTNLISTYTLEAKVLSNNSGSIILRTGTIAYNYGFNAVTLVSSPTSANTLSIISDVATVSKIAEISLGSLTATRTFTLPDLSGTLALLEGTQTFTGTKRFDTGVLIKNGVSPSSSGYTGIGAGTSGITVNLGSGGGGYLVFQSTAYDYTFPAASGTIALTSDLSAYVTLATTQTISGAKTFGSSVTINTAGQSILSIVSSAGNSSDITSSIAGVLKSTISTSATEFKLISAIDNILKFQSSTNFRASLIFSNTADYSYTYPNATGTLALTSDLGAYLPLAGGTLTGALSGTSATFSGALTVNGLINNTYSNNTFLGLLIRNTNTGDSALSGFSIQNSGGTTVGQVNYVSTVYANTTLRNTLLINTVFDNKLAFATNSSGGETRADIYFTVNPAFALNTSNPNQIHILGTSRNVAINYSGVDYGANFQVNGTTRLSDALTGTSASFSSSVTANSTGGVSGSFISNTFFGSIDLENTGGTVAGKWNVQSVSGAQVGGSAGSCFGIYSYTASAYRLWINGSGNVGIGTSSPTDTLHLERNGAGLYNSTRYTNPNSTANFYVGVGGSGVSNGSLQNNAYLYNVGNSAIIIATNDTERMRITSTGNVGIGTSAPAGYALNIANSAPTGIFLNGTGTGGSWMAYATSGTVYGYISTAYHVFSGGSASDFGIRAETNLVFGTGATERLRITSGGAVGFNGGADVTNVYDKFSMGYFNGNYGWLQTWNSTPLYFNKGGNAVYAGTQRIDNNSDQRIKENIAPIENALNVVLALNGRKFNMLDENGKLRYGFVAQEVQPHLADFVTESDRTFEKDDIKIENLLTLESSGAAWGALLVEAIKELEARIKQLENK